MDFKTKDHDSIEEEVSPHALPEYQEDGDLAERENWRMQISDPHLRKYGFTGGCRRCKLHKQGLHARAKHLRHSGACWSRIYRAIKAERGQSHEEEDTRLEVKHKFHKEPDKPKEKAIDPAPDTPVDAPMKAAPTGDLDMNAEVEDIGDNHDVVDVVDATEFFKEVDDAMDSNDIGDVPISEDHEMTESMDSSQTLGVHVGEAKRFSAWIMRISSQPMSPTFVEVYGCGNVVHTANHVLGILNDEEMDAFDLRTSKPNGDAWDFPRKSDRKRALLFNREAEIVDREPAVYCFQQITRAQLSKYGSGSTSQGP